jgi:hypothetical protein
MECETFCEAPPVARRARERTAPGLDVAVSLMKIAATKAWVARGARHGCQASAARPEVSKTQR